MYHTTDWNADIGHLSHSNARAGVAPGQQYACGANASRASLPRNNEVVCFPLDGSLRVLVVAPVMTDLNAAGGGDDYAKSPKGNLDVTGKYFLWTSNAGGNRLDAFIVRVPGQQLTGAVTPPTAPPPGPPTVTTTTPATTAAAVVWTGPVNVTVDGNSLRKSSGCDGCADAGAVSQQRIKARGGFIEVTASETATLRSIGLSRGSTPTPDMDFGLRLQSGYAQVRERGVYRADTWFRPGDVFRIKVNRGVVKYFKNGTRFYTSTTPPSFPLVVNASLANIGATIHGAVVMR